MGTARMESSAIDATSGVTNTPTPTPAAPKLKKAASLHNNRSTISGFRKLMANTPRTMLGIPASVSSIGLSSRLTRGLAYSDRYIAAPSPSGVATNMAIPVTTNDPARMVLMSKSPWRGSQPRVHSCPRSIFVRKSKAPPTSARTMSTLISTETPAMPRKSRLITSSLRRRRGLPSRSVKPKLEAPALTVSLISSPRPLGSQTSRWGARARESFGSCAPGLSKLARLPVSRPGLPALPHLGGVRDDIRRLLHVSRLGHDGLELAQVEVHVSGQRLVALRLLGIDVEVEVSRYRVVAGGDGVVGRLHAVVTLFGDRDRPHLVRVLGVEGESDPAQ